MLITTEVDNKRWLNVVAEELGDGGEVMEGHSMSEVFLSIYVRLGTLKILNYKIKKKNNMTGSWKDIALIV